METPPSPQATDVAWLAGLWDGEGSVGIVRRRTYYQISLQLEMTHEITVLRAKSLIEMLGIPANDYGYAGRQRQHAPSWKLVVGGMSPGLAMAEALLPYAVTKHRHWGLLRTFICFRVAAAGGFDEHGHVKRGGTRRTPYTPDDLAIIDELRSLNARGPKPDDASLDPAAVAAS